MVVLASVAQADLNRVGPSNVPSPPGHGFPLWYQDLNGAVLDLCLPNASDPGLLQETACLLARPPTPPYAFPTNFPEEIFYHRVVSAPLATSATKRATLVLALEAAFGSGAAAAGQQIVFTRIRVTAGVPFDGTYTVTHPYGLEVFTDVVAGVGNRDINFTEDVGIGAPGVFTGALTSRLGPFMQASAAPGGPASAPVNLNGAQFLSDGVTLVNITGSPLGTNYFEICGPFDGPGSPDRCIRENFFTLTGRLHNFVAAPIGSPMTITQSTYARNAAATQAQVDVGANAISGLGQAAANLTAAAPGVSPVLMRGPNSPALGDFYAQGIPVPATDIPVSITVTNSGDVPPTSVTRHVVDEVKVTQATWDPAGSGTLTVIATSSDKFATVTPPATVGATPALRVDGFPLATQVPGGIAGDPASVTITVTPMLIPPPSITVSSSAGGQGFSTVSMGLAAPFPCGVPFTQDDQAVTVQGLAVVIPVFANDSIAAACPLTPPGLPVVLAPGPDIGTATVLADGTISFTSGLTGTATFRYTLADAVGTSNVATVTVTVSANPGGALPTANPDGPFSMAAGAQLVIPAATLTANDAGNGGTLDPASIQIVAGSVTGGTATFDAVTGNVTYTAGAAQGSFSFQYTVANTLATGGQRSAPATVSITVIAAADQLTITQARFRTGIRRWDVNGTSTVSGANVVTVTLFRGTVNLGVVGTAPVVAGGWVLQVVGSSVIAQNGDRVVATSTANGSAQLLVQVRQ
jgi:hypothetical protein